MKYQLKDFNRNIPDSELLDDLRKVTEKLGLDAISSRQYQSNGGKYTAGTISIRFGSWNNALKKAGLKLIHQRDPSEEELFKNIENIWIKLGRQPVTRDMKRPLSEYSIHPYCVKFTTFRKALEAFIEFINSDNDQNQKLDQEEVVTEIIKENEISFTHKTKRLPSERLKVQVLMRDGNKCRLCGIEVTGSNIHFDHIKPWSKGGETVLENLQVLCAPHNLIKGNLYANK